MNDGKRRWVAAEEGQGWRRQQRARASLDSSCTPQEGSNLRMVALDCESQRYSPAEAACLSRCKQHKPSCENSRTIPHSENRSHVCVCCDEGCPAMNEVRRRWAVAEEGQGWRRQQRARASLDSSCTPQEGSNLRMVATDGPSQSCCPPEAACVSSCKQHKPSRSNSHDVPRSDISPRFHQQAHNGLMTSTCCPHERSEAVPADKRMRRERLQNNATQHHQHCSHRQQQQGRVTCPLRSRQPGTREAGAQWTHDLSLLPS